MEVDGRQNATLPPIGSFSSKMSNEEESQYHPRRSALPTLDTSAPPIPRSSSPYQGQRSHADAYNSNSVTSAAHSLASFAQRRSSGELSDPPSASAQGARYSLPSLYEALGMDKGSPRSSRHPSSTPMLAPTSHAAEPTSPKSHASKRPSDSGYVAHDRDQPFSWNAARTPYVGHIGPASPVRKAARINRASSTTPPHSSRQVDMRPHIHQSIRYDNDHPGNQNGASSAQSHKRYSEPSLDRHIPLATRDSSKPAYAPTSIPQRHWHPDDGQRSPESKKPPKAPYGESVKRHLEVFDLEQSLNGVSDASKQLLDFSEFYRQKAHLTQRSGPLPGSTPHIQEIDDMIENGARIHDSLNRIREVVVNQQAALAERSREQAMKSAAQASDEHTNFHDESKDSGLNGSDPKRRRGRAAPPGRCHSCNRAETPEWRRGPDGARTLCNACGLHYAKLTRKMGASKTSIGSSNLRPKAMDSGGTV